MCTRASRSLSAGVDVAAHGHTYGCIATAVMSQPQSEWLDFDTLATSPNQQSLTIKCYLSAPHTADRFCAFNCIHSN